MTNQDMHPSRVGASALHKYILTRQGDVRRSCHKRLVNPYQPPSSNKSQRLPSTDAKWRNPSRFLLYPIATLGILDSLGMASRFLRDGLPNRTPEYLNAGTAMVIGLIGLAALFLAIRRFSPLTKLLTVTWSAITLLLLATSLIFEQPQSAFELLAFCAVASLLVSVGILAIRKKTKMKYT